MSNLMNLNFSDIPELSHVSGGEYKVTVQEAAVGVSQTKGNKYIRLRLSICDQPNSKQLSAFLSLPDDNSDEGANMGRVRKIRGAFQSLSVALPSTIGELVTNTEEVVQRLVGATGWAILKEKEDEEYGTSNELAKWVAKG